MTSRLPGRSLLITVAAAYASATAATAAEIHIGAEGFRFQVSSIGEQPSLGAGADVSNSLRLEGSAPSLSLGVGLGPTRRAELRWRGLRDENVYATANPDLVLEGEQRVSWNSFDALLLEKLGKTPLRLELGYRYLGLDRSWRDAVGVGPGRGLATLDYSSQLSAHGLRGAIGLDVRFAGRLHLEGTLGLSLLRAQESLRSVSTDDTEYPSTSPDRFFDGARTVTIVEASIRLRVDITSRVFLAVGYRSDGWGMGDDTLGEFEAHGPTYAVGLRLGGPR